MDSARRGAKEVQVVSNDQMRDHHWRMLGPRAFRRWQGRHMTRVSIWSETPESMEYSVILTPPRPFSVQAQVASDGKVWHFPIPAIQSRAEQLQSGRPVASKEIEAADHKWLVAWCEACDGGRHRTDVLPFLSNEDVLAVLAHSAHSQPPAGAPKASGHEVRLTEHAWARFIKW
eukprot:5537075-Amphidinium_carterae.1